MAPLEFYMVNAFANGPHSGSQAAVVLLPAGDARGKNETYLQSLASDFRWPATVFLTPAEESESEAGILKYEIRWFTAEGELPLCGHGTNGAARVLFSLHENAYTIYFEHATKGRITATLEGADDDALRIGISLPITATTVSPDERHALGPVLKSAASLEPEEIVRVATYEYGAKSAVVQLDPSVDLANLKVDPHVLATQNRVTILTQAISAEGPRIQIRSRVFIPAIGLDEDVITGSAHSVLTGYYLSKQGGGRTSIEALVHDDAALEGAAKGKVVLDAKQLSRRGGSMQCSLVDGRARLVGKAYETGHGRLAEFPQDA